MQQLYLNITPNMSYVYMWVQSLSFTCILNVLVMKIISGCKNDSFYILIDVTVYTCRSYNTGTNFT